MPGGRIDFVENQFLLVGQAINNRNGLDKNKCYRVSLAEKIVIPICCGSREDASRRPPSWQLNGGGFPRGKCVLEGKRLVGGKGNMNIEIFNLSEEEVLLNKSTPSVLEVKED